MPTDVPAADGPVVGLGLVLDGSAEGKPGFCLGPVAESYPPQCQGLPLEGWDWSQQRGDFDNAGGVRFGSYAVTGTFDGTTLTYESAVPARCTTRCPGRSPPAPRPRTTPRPSSRPSPRSCRSCPAPSPRCPATTSSSSTSSMTTARSQDWADATYGNGLVFVHSALAPAARVGGLRRSRAGGRAPTPGRTSATGDRGRAPAPPGGAAGGRPASCRAAGGTIRSSPP